MPENINYLNKVVRALKVDEFTIIPYIYLDNEEELSIGKNKARPVRYSEYEKGESTKNNQHRNIMVVFHDFYDSFMTNIEKYQNLIKNTDRQFSIVLFNYPGQSFTIYTENTKFTN